MVEMSEMDLYRAALWIIGVVSTTFGSALIGIVLWNARRVISRQDAAEANIAAKLDFLQQYMQNELRTMDVRLSVVETLLFPGRPPAAARPSPLPDRP